MEFILVQHAEKDRSATDPANPGLTERGRAQARLTGERLRRLGVRRVIASPLRRAYETARIAGEALRSSVAPVKATVETDVRLRERMNWGDGAVQQTLPAFLADWARATADRTYAPPSGDSSRAAGARFLNLLEELAAAPPAAPIALVTHGGVTADLLRTLFSDDDLSALYPSLVVSGVPGCALTRLSRQEDGRYRIRELASVEHLPRALRTDWRAS